MLKRLTILLLEFSAGLAGNLVAGWIQQDAWQGFFTPLRLLGTVIGAACMLVIIALLESERNLSWNWRWHRFWYMRAVAKDQQIRRWQSSYARLKLAHGRKLPPSAEVIAEGVRHDVVEVLREIILKGKDGNQRALVLGEPGSGKTTALERLTWELARQGARRLGWRWRIPILLRLGNYQDGRLIDFAAEEMLHAASGNSGKVLSRGLPDLLEKGRVTLLCDALDEALGERRDLVLAEIDRLLRSRQYDKVPVIISARTREDPGNRLGELLPYTIRDLSDEAVSVFIQVYRRATDEETDVLARLQRDGLLEPGGLGRNPFWLQLVVSSGAFQARKGQLLIQSVETLLAREWDEKPAAVGWSRPLPRDEQLYETRYALMSLAYEMSINDVVSFPYEWVTHHVLPEWLRKRQGIGNLQPKDIVGLGRDAQLLVYWPGPISFRHRLIQEALTAQLLAEQEILQNDVIAQYVEEGSWWETLIMLGHLVRDPGALALKVLGNGQNEQRLFLAAGILQNSGEPEPDIRAALVDAIGRSLSQGVNTGHKAAVVALAQIIREDVLNLLLDLLQTESVELQLSSTELLITIQPLDVLLQAVDSTHQWAIIQALVAMDEDSARDLLADIPASKRIRYECALAQVQSPLPGAGITVRDGHWLPDIAWGGVVPAGEYKVGGDAEAYNSFAQETIEISQPYQLARYPVTYAQFQCFMDADDFAYRDWWEDIPLQYQEISEQRFKYWNHPREHVSWYQAVAFCRWLRDKLEADIDLPHEYEWEVAARYPDDHFYPWGDHFDQANANTRESGIGSTTAVGMFPNGANRALELYDLSGNVWEWCRNKYQKPEDTVVDKSGETRTLRGVPRQRRSAFPQLWLRFSAGASSPISSRSLITGRRASGSGARLARSAIAGIFFRGVVTAFTLI